MSAININVIVFSLNLSITMFNVLQFNHHIKQIIKPIPVT